MRCVLPAGRGIGSKRLLIFRNDDVNENTDIIQLYGMYSHLRALYPDAKIISGITVLSRSNKKGSVYGNVPFKDNPVSWFYDVDLAWKGFGLVSDIASHGLLHIDHSKAVKEVQEMSILTSCNLLKTRAFIPPFNRWNSETLNICIKNDIELIGLGGKWKSLEFEPFDPNHKYWYFHSWRFNIESFKKALDVNSGYMGQLRTDASIGIK